MKSSPQDIPLAGRIWLSITSTRVCRTILAPALAILPTTGLLAFSSGQGTEADPFVVTSSDTTMDVGNAYYIANSSVDFGATSSGGLHPGRAVYIGENTKNNYFLVTGLNTVVSSNTGNIGYLSGSNGMVTVTNGATWNNSTYLYIGIMGDGNLIIENGGTVSDIGATIGMNASSTASKVTVTGSGSFWNNSSLVVGGLGAGSLTVKNGAMITVNSVLSTGSGGTIYIAGGYIALKGDQIFRVTYGSYFIKVYDGTTWVMASADNLTATYYDGTTNVWSASELFDTYGSKIDLTGYTVITGGVNLPLDWADTVASEENWYDSSWYGWFYTDTSTYGNWIWHVSHGWQYAFPGSTTDATYMWDDATASWWYANSQWYPCVYSYATGRWYYFISGTTPSRKFWDYDANAEVGETSL